MERQMRVIQFAGFSNTGKTTFISQLVKNLSKKGYDVAVVKHHGHATRLVEQDENKDSWKFRQAGAMASTVIAGSTMQMQFSKKEKWSVYDALKLNEFLETDLVIIEGFKRESFPKIVLIREPSQLELINKLDNIKAILTWDPYQVEPEIDVPIFLLEDQALFFEWFLKNVMKDGE